MVNGSCNMGVYTQCMRQMNQHTSVASALGGRHREIGRSEDIASEPT